MFHLNDAKYECGSHRDVHTNLEKGYLFNPKLGGSKESLSKIILFAKKHKKHLILETKGNYKKEIKLINNILNSKNIKKINKKYN